MRDPNFADSSPAPATAPIETSTPAPAPTSANAQPSAPEVAGVQAAGVPTAELRATASRLGVDEFTAASAPTQGATTSAASASSSTGAGAGTPAPAPVQAAGPVTSFVFAVPASAQPAQSAPVSGASVLASTPSEHPAVGDQVVTALTPLINSAQGSSQVRLGLSPEGLGAVTATITLDGSTLSVQLGTDSAAAHEALRAALPQLQSELGAGTNLRTSVALSDHGAGYGGWGQSTPRDGNTTSPSTTPDQRDELDDELPINALAPRGALVDLRL